MEILDSKINGKKKKGCRQEKECMCIMSTWFVVAHFADETDVILSTPQRGGR